MAVRRRPRPTTESTTSSSSAHALEALALDLEADQLRPLEVTWLRRKGDRVKKGTELAIVRCQHTKGVEVIRKLSSPRTGTLEDLIHHPDLSSSVVEFGPSLPLGQISYCTHPYLRDDRMCAVCGEIAPGLAQDTGTTRVFVKGGHHVSVSKSEANFLYRTMALKLLETRKLNLILDIDLTLLHATIDVRAEAIRDDSMEVHSFDVMNQGRLLRHWCCLRPGLREFLRQADELYILTIYTHGRRDYAHKVAQLLDPDRNLFADRVVSRDDCPDLQGQKSLQRLFPGGIEMALILDDSPQVWRGEQSRHLLPVVPFRYYTDVEELNRVAGLVPSSATAASKSYAFGNPRDDNQLQHTWRILKAVHQLYYPEAAAAAENMQGAPQTSEGELLLPEGERPKNVAEYLAQYRGQCLAGLSIVFSGLLPRGVDPRRTDFGYMATSLGAEVSEFLTASTTHLVAENPHTEKVYHARQKGGIFVVSKTWLQLSFWHCERKDEHEYLLEGGGVTDRLSITSSSDLISQTNEGESHQSKRLKETTHVDEEIKTAEKIVLLQGTSEVAKTEENLEDEFDSHQDFLAQALADELG